MELQSGFESGMFDRRTVSAYAENLFDEDYYSGSYEKAFYGGSRTSPRTATSGWTCASG